MENKTIIGIDFGTSSTVIKIKNYFPLIEDPNCESLQVDGHSVIPSLIFKREDDGHVYFGRKAEIESAHNKGTLYKNFKTDLLHKDPNIKAQAQELTRQFFKFLYQQFEAQESSLHVQEKKEIYLSLPVKWPQDLYDFMEECVVNAGFGTKASVKCEAETYAALFAAITNQEEDLKKLGVFCKNAPSNIMLLDLGAESCDITIFRLLIDNENIFHFDQNGAMISCSSLDGNIPCGGRVVDGILVEYLENCLKHLSADGTLRQKSTDLCQETVKEWKEGILSPRLAQKKSAPLPGGIRTHVEQLKDYGVFIDDSLPEITRSSFELLSSAHWKQLHDLILKAIKQATRLIKGFQGPEDIDLIILAGGHSQWYCIKEMCLGQSVAELPAINFSKIKEAPCRLSMQSKPQETFANGLVQRDLSIDLKQASPFNIWIRMRLDENAWSEIYQPVTLYEPLPVTKTIEWEYRTEAKSQYSLDDIKLACFVTRGTSLETATVNKYEQSIGLNSLGGFLFKTAFAPFVLMVGNEAYIIKIRLDITIREDGKGTIKGVLSTSFNSGSNFVIEI